MLLYSEICCQTSLIWSIIERKKAMNRKKSRALVGARHLLETEEKERLINSIDKIHAGNSG